MTYDIILERCFESYENHVVVYKEYFEFYNNLIMIPSMLMISIAKKYYLPKRITK